ncbi:MAG: GNAT family N-acetyltransferase [Clostridiales bacterium]|nr:GNAT family N-acetyltransferase [Clostridiales bacterium]
MIEYRLAGPLDAEELAGIRLDFLIEAKGICEPAEKEALYKNNIEFFKSAFYDGRFVAWVAVEEGKIVGTSGISFFVQPPNKMVPTGKFAYITNMYTLPENRGQGIASKLFSLIVEEAKDRGCEKIMLNATTSGRHIYERFGFTDLADNMVFYTDNSIL